ncbi:CynX/NimT family MFS transporter [Flexivirga alba]|uniref:CynX/NimT family MFS transporter n=1 Tax=Flexivirga alba TaxID=702742 RepID=A0ABW2AF56_9MICO
MTEVRPADAVETSSALSGRSALVAAIGIMLVAANLRPAVVSVSPLIDTISDSFGFSSSTAGLLTAIPLLFFGISAPVAPRLAHRFGIEQTIFGALAVLVVGIALRLIAAPAALFGGSVLLGIGIGVCNVVLPALIKRDFAHRSGLMTGLYSMTLSGGAAVAAGLTVPIDDALGGRWRLTLAAWGLLVLVAMAQWVPQLRRRHVVSSGRPSSKLWRDRTAWAITVYMGVQSLIFYTFGAWLPKFLMDEAGMSSGAAGGVLALGQTVGLTCSLLAPIIAGRFAGQRAITLASLGICVLGFVGLLTVHGWWVLWAGMIMVGPGCGIGLALLFMVLRSNSAAQAGQVSGMAQAVGYGLAAIGPILIGAVHDASGSWTLAMTVLACAAIPQGIAALRAARDGKMTPDEG